MTADCVFCKIVAGQIPASRVYEDEDTLAFMDIGPVTRGHTLVIPKKHYDPITETPPDVLATVIATVRKIARAQTTGLGAQGVNVTQANGALAGQVVPHLHFHVIPRSDQDAPPRNWHPGRYDSDAEREAFASRLRAALAAAGGRD